MDTINYSKCKSKKSNAGLIAFIMFIILGSGVVIYSIINEPSPIVIGNDPLKSEINVYIDNNENKDNVDKQDDISYKIDNNVITETNGNFKASIALPVLKIDNISISEINDQILSKYTDRYELLKAEMGSTVENKFTYRVTYNTYANLIGTENIISITVYERIVDDKSKQNTMEQLDTYNINIAKKEILPQDFLASKILGTSYTSLIKEQVKKIVIEKDMIKEEEYKYNMTGLEKCYIKDNVFHIVLNPGQIVDKKYGIVDLIIK